MPLLSISRRSLRTWLLVSTLALVAVISSLILVVVLFQEHAAANRLASFEAMEASKRAHLRTVAVLRAAENTLHSGVRVAGPRIAARQNWPSIFAALMSAFEQRPSLTYLGFSSARTGEAAFLHRKSDGVVEYLVYLDRPDGSRVIQSHRFQNGEFFLTSEVPWDGWDPRLRPFFIKARERRAPVWTDSYLFTDPEGKKSTMGITYAHPVYDLAGELVGVWDTDFDSRSLCDAMRQYEADFGARFLIVERRTNGTELLIAHAQDSVVTGNETAAKPPAAWAEAEVKRAFSGVRTSSLHASATLDAPLPPWTIITLIPESRLSDLYLRQQYWVLLALLLGAAVITCIACPVLAYRLARPVEHLRGEMAAISGGKKLEVYQGFAPRELTDLGRDFARLVNRVEERQAQLEQSKRELEAEVRERQLREALLSAVFGHAPFELCILDREGRVLLQSAASIEILGKLTGQFFNKAAVSRAWALDWDSSLRRALEGEVVRLEIVEHPNQEARYLHALLAGVPGSSGRTESVICVCIDVTEKRRAEEALLASQRRLSVHLENTPLGVIEWSPEMTVTAWNQAAEMIFGWSPASALGKHVRFLMNAEALGQLQAVWKELLEGKSAARLFSQNLTKDGRHIECEWYNTVVTEPDGRISGVSSLILDVTERMKMELMYRESEERFQKAFRRAPVAQALVRISDFALLDVNDCWCEVFGHPRRLAIGRKETELGIWAADPVARERILRTLNKVGEVRDVEVRLVSASGREGLFLMSVTLVTLGSAPAMIISQIDITERKKAENEILNLNESLEGKVLERTEQLAQANLKLQELDRLKSEFLSTMSHELRTPLNAIIGFSSILKLGMNGPLNPSQKSQVELIVTSSKHLLSLINDLLDLSRIEAGRLELMPSEFALPELLGEVARTLQPLVDSKGLAYSTECAAELPLLHADRKRLFQVLLNLANNAVKFTEKGSVTVRASLADTDTLRVDVIDTGIGIRRESLPRLFEAFRQVDGSARRSFEGTGLGLHLVRRLMGMFRGTVDVASEFGVGSTFTLLMPLRVPAESYDSEWQGPADISDNANPPRPQ